MSIKKVIMDNYEFPFQKREIFYKFKEIKVLGGDVLKYVAQLTPQIDDEVVKKDRFWMETNYHGLFCCPDVKYFTMLSMRESIVYSGEMRSTSKPILRALSAVTGPIQAMATWAIHS